MVGLVGVVIQDPNIKNINIENLLLKMCHSIRHQENHKTDYYVKNGIGIGRVHANILNVDKQPIFNEDKSIYIIMDGEIFDYYNIKKVLISKGHKFLFDDNDVGFIIHLYEEYGKDFIHKLNGNFSIFIYDSKLDKAMIISDRFGLRPIYYTKNDEYLLFGSEVKAILQDNNFKKIIDDRSITEFFSFGYILGNKTFFNNIELIPPASIMSYSNGELSKLISQSVDRQMKGNHKVSVLLSGELDSRTILASIPKKYNFIHTTTYGVKDCNDVKCADMIAHELVTTHHFFEFKPEYILENIEELVYITDGMLNIFDAPRMQTYKEISNFSDITFHGWIGDSTMGYFLPESYLIKLIDSKDNFNIFKRLCNYSPINILRNLFSKNYFLIIEKNLKLAKNYISNRGESVQLSTNRLMYYNLRETKEDNICWIYLYEKLG